ncbi:allergen Tha p 1-like [Danaus plexippus]|uniref:allergen Tha p 1-like n=1 Tax=Danaus plexippus TaxID=13037 RepID=UPI002AB217CD|nr:allergen Tha p 1-like [Danaus plexippus]
MNRYKMKIFITLAALVINAVVAEEELYDLPLLDMREIARNPDQLKSFLDCLLDRAPCNPLYQGYRDLAPESIRESCRKCTPALKIFAYVFFTTLKTFLPEEYQNFRNKYDPDNIYIDRLEEEVRKYAFGTFSG